MRTVLAVVTFGAIAVACSSFGASESDLTESSDASTNDASGETGSPSDAGTDVSDGAQTGPFCTAPPSATAFCASFDDGNPPSFDWDGNEVSGGATSLEVVNGVEGIPSPPGALHAVVELPADTACYARATLSKTLSVPTVLSKVHAEFVTKVDAVSTRFSFARFMTQSAIPTRPAVGASASRTPKAYRITRRTTLQRQGRRFRSDRARDSRVISSAASGPR